MSYDNTNKGTIGKNKRKEQDSHPDIAGQINVDGVEYWLNGWQKKNSQTGELFYSLSVKPKQPRQDTPVADNAPATAADDLDDEIPF